MAEECRPFVSLWIRGALYFEVELAVPRTRL